MKRITGIIIAAALLISASALHAEEERILKEFRLKEDKRAELILEVDAGEVTVKKGNSRNTAVLEMVYSRDDFEYDIDYRARENRLRIILDKKGWFNMGDCRASIELSLPRNVELIMNTRVTAGEIEMEVGGLHISEFTLDNLAGDVEVSFGEPNISRMEKLKVHNKIGETELTRLGNAKFVKAEINSEVGELRADFRGEPLKGAEAEVDLEIGETTIQLPDNTGIRIRLDGGAGFLRENNIDSAFYKRGKYYYNDLFENEFDGFVLRASHGIGELTLDQCR
ncbi:MAG: hypothetical protein GF417_03735 [Candidatus Latescibacteria bacterium]|nr:hypothetical protein [Candidatus Latescibacterota bacterium]